MPFQAENRAVKWLICMDEISVLSHCGIMFILWYSQKKFSNNFFMNMTFCLKCSYQKARPLDAKQALANLKKKSAYLGRISCQTSKRSDSRHW